MTSQATIEPCHFNKPVHWVEPRFCFYLCRDCSYYLRIHVVTWLLEPIKCRFNTTLFQFFHCILLLGKMMQQSKTMFFLWRLYSQNHWVKLSKVQAWRQLGWRIVPYLRTFSRIRFAVAIVYYEYRWSWLQEILLMLESWARYKFCTQSEDS